jgi:hypothetical protein
MPPGPPSLGPPLAGVGFHDLARTGTGRVLIPVRDTGMRLTPARPFGIPKLIQEAADRRRDVERG